MIYPRGMELVVMPCIGCGFKIQCKRYDDDKSDSFAIVGTCFDCPEAIKQSRGKVRDNPFLMIASNDAKPKMNTGIDGWDY
jgi:hypothetical protein